MNKNTPNRLVLFACLALSVTYALFMAAGRSDLALWVAAPGVALAVAYCLPLGLLNKAAAHKTAEVPAVQS